MSAQTCELCEVTGGELLWQDARCRVIRVTDAHYPAFCRVVWRGHVAEMTDLDATDRAHLMAVVWATERVLRDAMQPDKINLASFGNMVPHVHWHVIPRFSDDRHFPQSVWGTPQRDGLAHAGPASSVLAAALEQILGPATDAVPGR